MSEFADAVDSNLNGITCISTGAMRGCSECFLDDSPDEEDYEAIGIASEGVFSWGSCDSCGSSLAGNRYPAHGILPNEEIIHLDICQDCVMYLANGEEPEEWE